jgi:cob(I)alamin adenosyltransferase
VEAVGALDELNVAIGVAKAARPPGTSPAEFESTQLDLIALMGEVSCAESDLARYEESKFAKLGEGALARLDAVVATLEARGLKFDGWATPGANPYSAALEVARTTARRAERRMVGLAAHGRVLRPVLLKYINRLSDALWLMAREAEM